MLLLLARREYHKQEQDHVQVAFHFVMLAADQIVAVLCPCCATVYSVISKCLEQYGIWLDGASV